MEGIYLLVSTNDLLQTKNHLQSPVGFTPTGNWVDYKKDLKYYFIIKTIHKHMIHLYMKEYIIQKHFLKKRKEMEINGCGK